uniref:inosine/xanthosine triphosphatase n=1 Tax=Alexandrium catenella TaxID=2925 RepID=A0A7S1PTW8_ALECA
MGAIHAAGEVPGMKVDSSSSASSSATVAVASRGAALGPPPVERRCRVVLASSGARSELGAVERVFRQCAVDGVRVPSNVNEQPCGHEEALRGAANRLDAAKAARPGADYYVAIESCLTEVWMPPGDVGLSGEGCDVRHFDTGWVLLERPGGGVRAVASSASVEVPAADVDAAKEKGLDRKGVGTLIAERLGLLEGRDPHSWLTAGRRDREALLGEAVAVALGQLERACRPPAFGAAGAGAGAAAGGPSSGGANVFRRRDAASGRHGS